MTMPFNYGILRLTKLITQINEAMHPQQLITFLSQATVQNSFKNSKKNQITPIYYLLNFN